jgi:hypothetical protein
VDSPLFRRLHSIKVTICNGNENSKAYPAEA